MEKIIEANDDKYKSGLFAFDGWNQPIHFDNILITGPGIPRSPGEAVNNQSKLPIAWGKLKMNGTELRETSVCSQPRNEVEWRQNGTPLCSVPNYKPKVSAIQLKIE